MRLIRQIPPVLMVLALLFSQAQVMAMPGTSCLKITAAEMCLDPLMRVAGKPEVKPKTCPDAVLMADGVADPLMLRDIPLPQPASLHPRHALLAAPWKPPRPFS